MAGNIETIWIDSLAMGIAWDNFEFVTDEKGRMVLKEMTQEDKFKKSYMEL